MRALRRAVVATVVSGQLAAAVAGVLPSAALLVCVPLLLGVALLTERADEARARLLRGGATVVALLLAVAVLPRAVDAGDPREVLGPLLVGVSVLQASTWRSRRDLQGGLLTGLGLLVLGASFAPDVLVGLPLLVGWCSALAGGVLAGRERLLEGADAVLPGARSRGLLLPTAVSAVLGLVVFLLLPVPDDAGLQSRLSRVQDAAGATRAALGAGIFTSGRVDLRVRGELGDRQLLEVDDDSPELWRGAVYDTWDGRAWTARGGRPTELPGPPFVVEDVAPTRTDDVRVLGRTDGTVLAPGRPVRLEDGARRAARTEDGAVVAEGLGDYRVASVVLTVPAVSRPGADADDPRWRQLPADLPLRVRLLAAQLTEGRDRPGAVTAVEDWLRANATYRTDSPVPGRGEDAVDRFLFVDRTGFCEQFAAAGTVLLRAAGIPARFVSGIAYGEQTGDGRRTFREKDLHTWVEVFHPGVGWVSSDPTAGTELAVSTATSLRMRLVAPLTRALRAADGVPGGRPAIAVGLLAVTAVVLARPRRRTTAAAGDPRARTPLLQAFSRWDDRLGERRRRRWESLGELTQRLDLPADEAHALAVLQAELYAPVAPDGRELARAAEVLSAGGGTGGSDAGRSPRRS